MQGTQRQERTPERIPRGDGHPGTREVVRAPRAPRAQHLLLTPDGSVVGWWAVRAGTVWCWSMSRKENDDA